MDFTYMLTPFLAWFVAGILKFIINSIRARRLAFGLIGYGGLPSNHSAIVSSMVALIYFREGVTHPALGVAVTLAFIVVLDANSLRRQIGKHAEAINLHLQANGKGDFLRERIGHSRVEIIAGIILGFAVAYCINKAVIFFN